MKRQNNNNKRSDFDTFPIIPFVHMTYALISSRGNSIEMNIGYENGKKRKVSIY